MEKFYEKETPIAVHTDAGSFEYYPEAQRFSVALPFWYDSQGVRSRGKTVSLAIPKLKSHAKPVIEILKMLIADLESSGGCADEQ